MIIPEQGNEFYGQVRDLDRALTFGDFLTFGDLNRLRLKRDRAESRLEKQGLPVHISYVVKAVAAEAEFKVRGDEVVEIFEAVFSLKQ